jgi:hypothetical protein
VGTINTTKEFSVMKKIFEVLVLTVYCFGFIGCGLAKAVIPTPTPVAETTIGTEKEGLVARVVPETPRDFTVKGIIFVSSNAKINSRGEFIEGSDITFDMLMREAQKLGGEDFVNLRIDERKVNEGNMTRADYKATALAIKYK